MQKKKTYFTPPRVFSFSSSGQFHQHAYAQLFHAQIPKAQKDSQVFRRNKVDCLLVLLYFSGFALYTVHSSLVKLTSGRPSEHRVQSVISTRRTCTFLFTPLDFGVTRKRSLLVCHLLFNIDLFFYCLDGYGTNRNLSSKASYEFLMIVFCAIENFECNIRHLLTK